MTRICVIGNSHLAAIMHGWQEISHAHPDIDMTFFGSARDTLKELVLEDGVLKPGTELLARNLRALKNCPDKLILAEFDEFWLGGLFLTPRYVIRLYARCWSESMTPSEDKIPVSDKMFTMMITAYLKSTLSFELMRLIRAGSNKIVRMIQQPYYAGERDYTSTMKGGDDRIIAKLFRDALSSLESEGVTTHAQPAATLGAPISTLMDYTMGSLKLKKGDAHEKEDVGHMNARYGATIIEDILAFSQGFRSVN